MPRHSVLVFVILGIAFLATTVTMSDDCLRRLQGEAAEMLVDVVDGLQSIARQLEQRLPSDSSCGHRKKTLLPTAPPAAAAESAGSANRRALSTALATMQFLKAFGQAEQHEGLRSLAANSVKTGRRLYVASCLLGQLSGVGDSALAPTSPPRWLRRNPRSTDRYVQDYILCWNLARVLLRSANELVNGTLTYSLAEACK